MEGLNININTESLTFIGIHTGKGNNKDENKYEGNQDFGDNRGLINNSPYILFSSVLHQLAF